MGCKCEEHNTPETEKEAENRRGFLTKLIFGSGAFVATVLGFPLVTAMLDPVTRKREKVWRQVGALEDFLMDETKMVSFMNASPYKWSSKISHSATYIRREENNKLTAFSVNCAHLGCPVRWDEGAQLFMCPCHGGVYYKDGSRAAGPPLRGLYQYPVRIVNNQVEIETEAIPITNISS